MENARIVLRCMDGRSLSPGQVHNHQIPFSHEQKITEIVQRDGSPVVFQECTTEDVIFPRGLGVIARIYSKRLCCVLEPLQTSVFIEHQLPPELSGSIDFKGIEIPISKDRLEHNFIYLRPDDTINLSDCGVKIEIMLEKPESSPSPTQAIKMPEPALDGSEDLQQPEIQVQSSNAEPEVAKPVTPTAKQDDETDSEDDLDEPSSARTHVTAVVANTATPVMSRTADLTVKETPKKNEHTDQDAEPLFLTAPSALDLDLPVVDETDIHLNSEAETSPMKTGHWSQGLMAEDSQFNAGTSLIDTVEGTPESEAQEISNTEEKGSRRPTPQTGEPNTHPDLASKDILEDDLPDLEAIVTPEAPGADGRDEMQDERQVVQPTSGELDASDVVVNGSSESSKRKSSKDDDDIAPTKKKCKTQTSAPPETPVQKDDGDESPVNEFVEEVSTGKSNSSAKNKKRKLPKAAESPEGDEIEVRKRTSPQVEVKRARASQTPASSPLEGKAPKILLSGKLTASDLKAPTTKWLRAQGCQIIEEIPATGRSNFVCVVKSQALKTTAKILRSLIHGKPVVTEQWIWDSKNAGKLLDTDEYIHDELKTTIKLDRRGLFEGANLLFTNALQMQYGNGWHDIETLVKDAGASFIESGTASKLSKDRGRNKTIFFGAETNDPDGARLIKDHGRTVYHKDLITYSIITGELNLDDDKFKLAAGATGKTGRR